MATKLLPAAKIGVKKKTISADSLRPNYLKKEEKPPEASEKSSTREILVGIRDFITAKFKRGISSFTMKRREKQKERIEAREKKIENEKGKLKLRNLIKPPKFVGNIFSSITNFLLFVAGGILFNILGLEKSLMAIEKTLEIIGKGVQIFANIVGMFTNFIDSAVRGYDEFLQNIEDVTGFDKTKIEKFMNDFKYVINGAIIAAIFALRSLPSLMRRKCLPNNFRNNRGPNINSNRRNNRINNRRTTSGGQQLNRGPFSRVRESLRNIRNRIPFLNSNVSKGSNAFTRTLSKLNPANFNVSTGSNAFTRNLSKLNPFNNKITKGTGAVPKVAGGGQGKGLVGFLKNIKLPVPRWLTGWKGNALINSIFAYFEFKGRKSAGQSDLKATSGTTASTAGGFAGFFAGSKIGAGIGAAIGAPFAGVGAGPGALIGGILGGIAGSMGGSWLGGSASDAIVDQIEKPKDEVIEKPKAEVGDKSKKDIASLMDYADYELELTEITNNIIQPIQV